MLDSWTRRSTGQRKTAFPDHLQTGCGIVWWGIYPWNPMWGPKGRAAVQRVPSCANAQHPPYQRLHLTCSVAQAQTVNMFWHKRPRAEASLGSARGPSPVWVQEEGTGPRWHKHPGPAEWTVQVFPHFTIVNPDLTQKKTNWWKEGTPWATSCRPGSTENWNGY